MKATIRPALHCIALAVFMVLCWELICRGFNLDDLILPPPSSIFAELLDKYQHIFPHAAKTLYTTIIGLGWSIVFGGMLGILIGSSRLAYDAAYPLLVGFNAIPKVAIVPLLVLWFGAGETTAVITAATTAMFPIVVNLATGLANTEPELEDVLKTLKATRMDILLNVALPRAAPYFFASLKVAVALAFVGTVAAETVAGNGGIGYLLMTASASFNIQLIFCGLLTLMLMGVVMHVLSSWIEARLSGGTNRKS